MATLDDFYKMDGMDIIEFKKTAVYKGNDVNLSFNRDNKSCYISFLITSAQIAFGFDGEVMYINPILDGTRSRLYFIPDGKRGYRVAVNKASRDRINFTSKPLYANMVKKKFDSLVSGNLLFDKNLNAYYVEVK